MTNANFNLQADLLHVEAVLDRLLAAIEAVTTLGDSALSIQRQMSEIGYTNTEEEREWLQATQRKAKAIADVSHSVPVILWSFADAPLDIPGDLVKSIEKAMKENENNG